MQAGVRVFTRTRPMVDMLRISPRVVRPWTLNACHNQVYRPDAFVADGKWQAISNEWICRLDPGEGMFRPGFDIAVIRVEDDVFDCFRELRLMHADSKNIILSQQYQTFLDAAFTSLSLQVDLSRPFELQGLAVQPPGLVTVTINDVLGAYIGLHVDSWDGTSVPQSGAARSRICVNLGEEPRRFQFLPIIFASQDPQAYGLGEGARDALAERILATRGGPVLELSLAPGEAYLAPTDNIIHDGCTLGRTTLDYNLNLRGHFNLLLDPREAGARS
jgi:hypothetical protein